MYGDRMSGIVAFAVGTAAFAIGFLVLRFSDFWRDGSNGWWLWVAAASTVGGLLGVWFFADRRRRHLRREVASGQHG